MNPKASRDGLAALALSLIIALGTGCAAEGDVDRTQANRLPKSMFDGTWYLRSTVIDVPSTATASWIGQNGVMEKIRWDIQEEWLIAYRAYEEVPGTDSTAGSASPDESYSENPIAAFPIESHFDIKRDYNPATGEQNNVIMENTEDRPWHERDWMRINWADSEVDGKAFFGASGRVNEQAKFYVQAHEDSADALRVIDRAGQPVDFESLDTVRGRQASSWAGEVDYFDMVGRFLLEPETVRLRYGGSVAEFPLCWFISYGGRNYQTASCGPTEVKVRTAFMRVGQRNFEPVSLPNREMGKFGYFRQERFTWDRRYGFTETGRIYLADVHNIWEKAYEAEEDGSLVEDEDGQYVPIPPEQRTPKPITYHLNEDYPCELVATAHQVAEGWNHAFRRTVAVAKGLLTRTTGDTAAELAAISKDEVPDMFRLALNGWVQKTAGDDWSCENLERDESQVEARLGDLRYSFIAWVPDRQIVGPLGYGPSSADPETGEIITGMAYVYGAALDTRANDALEIIRLLNGDLEDSDFVSAEHIRDYIAANRLEIDPAKIPAAAAQLRGEALDRALINDRIRTKLSSLKERGLEKTTLSLQQSRLDLLKGTVYESKLLDDEIVRAIGPALLPAQLAGQLVGPVDTLPEEARQLLSPFNWASPEAKALDELRRDRAARQSLWLAEFADDSIQGLAEEIWEKHGATKDYEAMWQQLRRLIFRGVMEHEVGHAVGLRHNFAGSYDSINYDNRYWQLRAEPDAEGNGGVIERDPFRIDQGLTLAQIYGQAKQTEAQKSGRMREYQYSSLMDYHAKFNSDVHGLGKYDEAAILFAYGGHVEVFDQVSEDAKTILRQRFADCLPRFESIPNPAFDYLLEQWHYSSVWNLLGRTEGMTTRRFVPWAEVKEEQKEATEQCKAFVSSGGPVDEFVSREDIARDAEVPYMFCGDEYAGATQSCQRWDLGADPREQVEEVIGSYRSYYFFNNFKRDRFPFDAFSAYRRASRAFGYLTNTYQHWLFEASRAQLRDQVQQSYWTIATFAGFNSLMESMTTPAYGTYCRFENATGDCKADGERWGQISEDVAVPTRPNRLVIDRGLGRRQFSRFDYNSGYDYQYQILETGHFWEYLAAIDALTRSTGTFIGREIGSDFTTYLVPYYLIFDDALTRYFEGIVADDYEAYAPRVVDGELRQRVAVSLQAREADGAGGERVIELNPANGQLLADPSAGEAIDLQNWFTLKFYALVQGMLDFRSLYSLRFVDRQQIFRLGSGDENTPAPNAQILTCEDPIGGHVYGTIFDTSLSEKEQSGAVRMIRDCQAKVASYSEDPDDPLTRAEMNDTIEWLNFMRGLYQILGNNVL